MFASIARPLALVAAGSCLLLAGCESARFGGRRPAIAVAARPVPAPEPDEPVAATVPSGSVIAEPLPPPGGAASVPVASLPPPQPTAALPNPEAGSSRSTSVGGWSARDAAGGTCRVTLSSTPSLDLYRASAPGCPNKDLAAVTAWDFRDGEVYLFQPGGAVAARLRGGGGGLSGVLAKSGAPLTLTR